MYFIKMDFNMSHFQRFYSTLTFINAIVTMPTYYIIAIFPLYCIFYFINEE